MNNAPADPLSWFYDIPVVTRVYLTAAFVTTVSGAFRPVVGCSLLSCCVAAAYCLHMEHGASQIIADALHKPVVESYTQETSRRQRVQCIGNQG